MPLDEPPAPGYPAPMRLIPLILAVTLFPSLVVAASPSRLIDKVTRVRDGDTIVVGLIPIRLANLNCAEKGTIAGEAATRRMRQLVTGKTLVCYLEGRRSYDREVGQCVLPSGVDVGEVLIAEGYCRRWR